MTAMKGWLRLMKRLHNPPVTGMFCHMNESQLTRPNSETKKIPETL